MRLQFYTVEELELIVRRGARIMGLGMTDDGALEIARRARGTPRIAGRLLRRVRDFAEVAKAEAVTQKIADEALTRLSVDSIGLDQLDRRYLDMIVRNFGGGPAGSRPSRRACPSRATPSRISSNPTSFSRASCSARRAAVC